MVETRKLQLTFQKHGIDKINLEEKYNTPSAQLYKKVLDELVEMEDGKSTSTLLDKKELLGVPNKKRP